MERFVSFDVGLRNLAYVVLSVPHSHVQLGLRGTVIESWELVDLLPDRPKASFDVCIQRVLEFLNETEAFEAGCDVVLIENQPRCNPRLKSVQIAMFSYFKTMHLHTSAFPDVRLVSAGGKLRLCESPPAAAAAATSSSYSGRKRASIVACEHYLRSVLGDVHRADEFAASRGKRDDLADCLLQALAFIERRHLPPSS